MDSEKNIRAFLAIEPAEEILAAVSRFQEKLKREISGSISWTRPEGNHLTLKFFGNISSSDVENISALVKARTANASAMRLCIKGIGVFPSPKRPRVLWLGSSGDVEQLTQLQNKLDVDFASLGFERENRPFRAHLTLARFKMPQIAGLDKVMIKCADFSAGEFVARELILFQSHLSPKGATYTRLATFILGKENGAE